MTLLQEIIANATNDQVPLATVLRKCRILAARLPHEPLKTWVDRELNGYETHSDLPAYRVASVVARGILRGPFGAEIRNQPIPPAAMDKRFREWATTSYLTLPIAAYEQLAAKHAHENSNEGFRCDWPADLVLLHQDKLISGYGLVAAWQDIPSSAIYALLDTVRNRILSFALEIESDAPNAGEPNPQGQVVPIEKLNQTFTTIILGGSNVFAPGGSGISQVGAISVTAGDITSLKTVLNALGLSSSDLRELDEVLESESPPTSSDRFGPKLAGWMGKVAGKAASGTLKVATDVATKVATSALLKYYGLE